MDKDRESVHPVAGTEDVQIVYRRSSARPIEYAILLQVRGAEGWETCVVADNSHVDRHVDEHHLPQIPCGREAGRRAASL